MGVLPPSLVSVCARESGKGGGAAVPLIAEHKVPCSVALQFNWQGS